MVRHRWRIIYKFGGAALDTVAVLQRLPFGWTNQAMERSDFLLKWPAYRRKAWDDGPLSSTPRSLQSFLLQYISSTS